VIIIGKILACILVFAAAYFFSYWLLFVQIFPDSMDWLAMVAALVTAMMLAGLCWRWMSAGPQSVFATVMTWGAVVGAIGFCGGFFGPMIFTPDANQGPLLGLFITGPLGFVGGAIAGLVYRLSQPSRMSMG
jgi:hypothetical protein